jgi:glyoxylase-like metal-dependent hydrolase (beta-lactamase superfamily II)
MQQQRRNFLKTSAYGVAGLAGLSAFPQFSRVALSSSVFPVGDASLMVLTDGNLVLPGDFIIPDELPADLKAEDLSEFASKNGLPTDSYEPPCNITLWQNEDHLVLFDVGAGPNFMETTGKLLLSLEEAGIDPTEVTDVVFTHAHPDHLWGLIDDFDELAFPEANYHMAAAEWDFWRASDTMDKMPESRQFFVVGAQNRLALLEDRIQLFQTGAEVVAGVEAVDTSGHTPGHTSFALHSGNDSVMVLGDALTHAVLSFQKYDWPAGSDQDKEQGRATRTKLLDRLAHEQTPVVGFHLPYPGFGRAERSNGAYRFSAG